MKARFTTFAFVAVCFLTQSFQLSAHHGNASYDNEKGPVVMSGTATEWIWSNPHGFLKMDVKDENGEVKHWIMEAADIPAMIHSGLSRNCIKPGDQVSVTVIVAKNGVTVGRLVGTNGKLMVNGKPLQPSGAASSGDAQPAPKP